MIIKRLENNNLLIGKSANFCLYQVQYKQTCYQNTYRPPNQDNYTARAVIKLHNIIYVFGLGYNTYGETGDCDIVCWLLVLLWLLHGYNMITFPIGLPGVVTGSKNCQARLN